MRAVRKAASFATLAMLGVVSCKPSSTSAVSIDASTAIAAVDAAPPAPDASASADLAPDGPALYAALCAVCHAADGTGYRADNAPSLVSRTFLESASDDLIRRSIVHGRPGTAMAAYGREVGGPLDPDAVGRILAWIRGHGPAPLQLSARAVGDAKRGAPIYAAKCERCHGNAKTRATAVHLANPRFLEVASDPFLAYAIAEGRPGTQMEAWKATLTAQQIDDVVAFLRGFATPPVVGSLPAPTGHEPLVINPNGKPPSFTLRANPCPTPEPCKGDPRFVSVEQVKQALADNRRMIILDARPPSDWMRAHIPGAVSVPYHDQKRLAEVPNDGTWVIAYCACPHHLSGDLVDALRRRGVKNAVVLDEGILEWHRRGYPVIAAPGVEPPPKIAPAFVPLAPASAGP